MHKMIHILFVLICGVWCAFLMDKVTKILYQNYQDLWKKWGEPGGWFWAPSDRSRFCNIIITHRFWVKNQFGFPKEDVIPCRIRNLHRAILVILLLVLAYVLFVPLFILLCCNA
jgi:hypothetical protein